MSSAEENDVVGIFSGRAIASICTARTLTKKERETETEIIMFPVFHFEHSYMEIKHNFAELNDPPSKTAYYCEYVTLVKKSHLER